VEGLGQPGAGGVLVGELVLVAVVMAVKTTDYLVTASTEWSRMQDLT
jgi:hypothetical protein